MTREEEIRQAQVAIYGTEHCRAAEHFKAGVQWADTHPHWISVEDELPKERQWVIVYGATSDLAPIDTSCFESKSAWEWLGVTHWMPLPQPPKP